MEWQRKFWYFSLLIVLIPSGTVIRFAQAVLLSAAFWGGNFHQLFILLLKYLLILYMYIYTHICSMWKLYFLCTSMGNAGRKQNSAKLWTCSLLAVVFCFFFFLVCLFNSFGPFFNIQRSLSTKKRFTIEGWTTAAQQLVVHLPP